MRFLRRLCAVALLGASCLLAGAAVTLPAAPAAAQQTKSGVTPLIQRGAELFDDQQYEESIQTLSAALLRPGSTTKEKTEIYRLLAYNYITLKRAEEADAAVRGLFVLDESFTLAPNESPRFRDFFEATKKKWIEEGKPGKSTEGTQTAAEAPIRITHSSPAQVEPGATVKLTGSVDDAKGRVRGVQIGYRAGAKGKFIIVAATFTLGQFRAQIPGKDVKPPLIEYYVEAIDNGGLPIGARGDAATPLRIVVPEKQRSSVFSSPAFWIPVGVVVVGAAVGVPVAFAVLGQKGTSTVRVGVKE